MISDPINIHNKESEEEIFDIQDNSIKHILSYNLSLTKQKTIVTTQQGFCLINNVKKTFSRFQRENNPFHPEKTGIKIGSVLEERNEVALVPSKNTKKYSKTTVYIYDFKLKTILYHNDFFLPIRQLTLTDESIIVGNNKRIIVYDYADDTQQKDQKYYLDMLKSNEPNSQLRYFQMHCEQKFANNALNDCDEQELGLEEFCRCGNYVISGKKPYKMVFMRVYSINNTKRISLILYNWALDKEFVFQSFPYQQPFSFTISPDGDFLTFSENYGKTMKVYDLLNNKLFCSLWISRSIKPVLCHGFFKDDDSLWYTVTRKDGTNNGNMHLFKIVHKSPTDPIESQYKRYFSLYEKTFQDYKIAEEIIGPDFYVEDRVVYSFSLCGIVHDVIDFKRSGNHPKKNVENFVKWFEEK